MLIINGKIYTMAGTVYEKGYVRTEGKLITEVGPMDDALIKKMSDSRRKDGEGECTEDEILDAKGGWGLHICSAKNCFRHLSI